MRGGIPLLSIKICIIIHVFSAVACFKSLKVLYEFVSVQCHQGFWTFLAKDSGHLTLDFGHFFLQNQAKSHWTPKIALNICYDIEKSCSKYESLPPMKICRC